MFKLDRPYVQNEQMKCSTWTDGCAQNEQTKCSTWTDRCVQFEQTITIDYTESTTENTSETTSSSSKQAIDDEERLFHIFRKNGFGKVEEYDAKKINACLAHKMQKHQQTFSKPIIPDWLKNDLQLDKIVSLYWILKRRNACVGMAYG